MPQLLDVSGLPEPVVESIQSLVESLRVNLYQNAVAPAGNGRKLSAAQKLELLNAWVNSHAPSPIIADDSRESIYAGRGE